MNVSMNCPEDGQVRFYVWGKCVGVTHSLACRLMSISVQGPGSGRVLSVFVFSVLVLIMWVLEVGCWRVQKNYFRHSVVRRISEGMECSWDVEQEISEDLELLGRQCLSHDICYHFFCRLVYYLKLPSLDPVCNEKITKGYMSCPFCVRLTIFKQLNCRHVILKQSSRLHIIPLFFQEISCPKNLVRSFCCRY